MPKDELVVMLLGWLAAILLVGTLAFGTYVVIFWM